MSDTPMAETPASIKEPEISVVVPAYNAASTLRRCLNGLLEAGFTPDQIVLVDDASKDDTPKIAESMGVKPIALTSNGGAAVARNAGARAASGDVLFFVDADVVLHKGAYERVTRFFRERPEYAALFGAYDVDPPEGGIVSRFRNLLHRHVHVVNAGEASTFWTGCGAMRREHFEAVGGFDPAERWVMIEDVVLGVNVRNRGGRIWIDPDLQCTHLKAWTLHSMCKTDLFYRAMPWARLLKTEAGKHASNSLNLSSAGKFSGLAVAGSLASLPLAVLSPAAGLALLAGSFGTLAAANGPFLAFLRRERGAGEAITALPLLWLHYLCACLGFAWVAVRD